MSKVAGIHNKSPETYPSSVGKPTVLESLSKVDAGPVTLNNGGLTSLLGGGKSFTPTSTPARAIVMFSGVLQAASVPGIVSVFVVLDTVNQVEVQVEVQGGAVPVPFSFLFETGALVGPQTIDIQGETAAGTVSALDSSLVILVVAA